MNGVISSIIGILTNGWFCIGIAIVLWLLKGIGILGFDLMPGWPIGLFVMLAICNFIVYKRTKQWK